MILTEDGFKCSYAAALTKISCVGSDSMVQTKWLLDYKKDNSKLTWLFMYALDSYVYNATDNYITEEQVSAMFNKINLL